MPCKLWVSVLAARDLPIMDTKGKNRSTDAFVEVMVPGSRKKISKTDICKRTLNPVWNSRSQMEFEIVDDAKLQDSPVQFKVKDKNIVTEDFIGVVRVDMSPCMDSDDHAEIQGWFPIWDTLRGLSGELRIRLRLEHIIDRNKYDGSVSGIKFFASSALSPNLSVEIVGFVEELVVEEDPEFSWADQLRSARKSNEKRIKRYNELSLTVRRLIGVKVHGMGCNAVLGYRHDFDIEGDSGVVSRGYGTACRIKERAEDDDKPIVTLDASIERRIRRSGVMLLTLEQIPPSKHITSKLGGVVGARSVKYLGKLKSTDADTETRDKWWAELREEIRANARALKCDFIVGYTEDATIRDDVCILSVQGTALSMIPEAGMYSDRSLTTMRSSSSFHRNLFTPLSSRSTSAPVSSLPQHVPSLVSSKSATSKSSPSTPSSYSNINISTSPCQFCHVPCSENDAPFANMKLVRCGVCSNGWVPEILLATIEPPTNLPMLGRGHLVEARLCRQWRKTMGGELREEHASQVSRDLPFVEYELHRQLMLKLKAQGFNAGFCFTSQIHIGANTLVCVLRATALHLPSLPAAPMLKILNVRRREDLSTDHRYRFLVRAMQTFIQRRHSKMRRLRDAFARVKTAITEHKRLDTVPERSIHPMVTSPIMKSLGSENDNNQLHLEFFRKLELPEKAQLTLEDIVSWPKAETKALLSHRAVPVGSWMLRKSTMGKTFAVLSFRASNGVSECLLCRATGGSGFQHSVRMTDPHAEWRVENEHNEWCPKKRVPWCKRYYPSLDDAVMAAVNYYRLDLRLRIGSPDGLRDDLMSNWQEDTNNLLDQPTALDFDETSREISPRYAFVAELVDDRSRPSILSLLGDGIPPRGMAICNTEIPPGSSGLVRNLRLITSVKRIRCDVSGAEETAMLLSKLFKQLYAAIAFKLRNLTPCSIAGLDTLVTLPSEQSPFIQVTSIGMALEEKQDEEEDEDGMEEEKMEEDAAAALMLLPPVVTRKFFNGRSKKERKTRKTTFSRIEMTPLSFVPGAVVTKYCGRINLLFIKESWTVRESGGVAKFFHQFFTEANSIVRAHCAALGANAMLMYRLKTHESGAHVGIDHIYSFFSISGDAVCIRSSMSIASDSTMVGDSSKEQENGDSSKEQENI